MEEYVTNVKFYGFNSLFSLFDVVLFCKYIFTNRA